MNAVRSVDTRRTFDRLINTQNFINLSHNHITNLIVESGIFITLKKVVAIFFLITYGFTNVGATIHLHHCMDKFVGTSLFHSNNNKCGKCGTTEKNKKDCCKDEHKQLKIEKAQQITTSDCNFSFLPSPAIVTHFHHYSFAETTIIESVSKANSPPPKQVVSVYILYSSYRI